MCRLLPSLGYLFLTLCTGNESFKANPDLLDTVTPMLTDRPHLFP